MLPLCSSTPCSSLSQIFVNDGFCCYPRSRKLFDIRCFLGNNALLSFSKGISLPGVSLQKDVGSSLYSEFVGSNSPLSNEWQYAAGRLSDSFSIGREHLKYVEDSTEIVSRGVQITDVVANNTDILLDPSNNESVSILDKVAESTANIPDGQSVDSDSLPASPSTVENFLSETNESIGASISQGTDAFNSSLKNFSSAITGIMKDGNEGIENLTSKVLSSVGQTSELTRNRLINLPNDLRDASSKAGVVGIDLLRKTIIVAEDSLVKGVKFVYYLYESSKEILPPEIQNALVSFEDKAREISRPVGMVFLQVYSAIEGLERSLGLDPSDPIVPFTLFFGTTSTLWVIYWVVTYSGYAGDLPPKLAFELLSGKDDSVLIDVRPEDLREHDGVPDLRRAARFRYAHVSFPEVDGSLRKLMKNSKDLDDALIAVVIRNLKNVRDSSKIIVMDADGSRAKAIARSLRKLGIKRPYVLYGGFQAWVKEGLRIKELKPETTITILSEEAEAILEDLRPSPLQLLGIGAGAIAALYALVEWEKTLQLIGVIGLGQTIYRRVASYENSEDLWKDIGLLLSPVRVGALAVSLVAAKRDINGNGLPVSPSSSDVQNRVLQAAAKHESQPLDEGSQQDTLLDTTTSAVSENVDLSEA